MSEMLLWLVLFATAITVVLVALLLVRGSRVFRGVGKEVRDDLRLSREEARTAAKELREEVAGGMKTAGEALSGNLSSLGNIQQAHLEGMTKQLKELAESNQGALDRIRTTFALYCSTDFETRSATLLVEDNSTWPDLTALSVSFKRRRHDNNEIDSRPIFV